MTTANVQHRYAREYLLDGDGLITPRWSAREIDQVLGNRTERYTTGSTPFAYFEALRAAAITSAASEGVVTTTSSGSVTDAVADEAPPDTDNP